VVFRAFDTEAEQTVAVRRFFPFGADGGGLHAEEQTAYEIAISRLAGLRHPALRSVICGGCDPVDGMPFIATEWIEGDPLDELVSRSVLPPEAATLLVTQALEVSEVLSRVLAEEAVWVETDLQTIIVSRPDSGRGFTFWISPFKWLGGHDATRGLDSIADLAEKALGWSGKVVSDQAGRGFGGWLKWLRKAAATTTLKEARESLAAATGTEPSFSAKRRPAAPVAPAKKVAVKRRRPIAFFLVNTTLALATSSLAAWVYLRHLAQKDALPAGLPAILRDALMPSSPEEVVESFEAPEETEEPPPSAEVPAAAAETPSAAPTAAAPPAPEPPPEVVPWNDYKRLLAFNGKNVIVAGQVVKIDSKTNRDQRYVLFSTRPGKNDFRGAVALKNRPPDLDDSSLGTMVGKRVRIHGKLVIQRSGGLRRPIIQIIRRDAVEVFP